MDNKKIEDMLRSSWPLQTPDGMRDRVLRQARLQSVKTSKNNISGINKWKFILVSLAVVIIVMCNVSDHARTIRMAKMAGSYSNNEPFPGGKPYLEMRDEMNDLIASVPYESVPKNTVKGDESL